MTLEGHLHIVETINAKHTDSESLLSKALW